MTGLLQSLLLLLLLAQVYSYKNCHVYHKSHDHDHDRIVTIRCSDSEYCCDKGCCRKVYSIWYFWTLLLFGVFIALLFCWWYKAHQRRQNIRVVQRSVIPMQVVQPYPQQAINMPNQPGMGQYPGYPTAFAPPPYSVAMNPPPPMYAPPGQLPPQAGQAGQAGQPGQPGGLKP